MCNNMLHPKNGKINEHWVLIKSSTEPNMNRVNRQIITCTDSYGQEGIGRHVSGTYPAGRSLWSRIMKLEKSH